MSSTDDDPTMTQRLTSRQNELEKIRSSVSKTGERYRWLSGMLEDVEKLIRIRRSTKTKLK